MRFLTAGESHGKGLVGILDGVPQGLFLDESKIAIELERRRRFYGRSERMTFEADDVEFLSGLHAGATTGAPISFIIHNKDYRPSVFDSNAGVDAITKPRPGHADYSGMVKYGLFDARMIAERASGRETATRTVVGAIARQLLEALSISVDSHVVGVGNIQSNASYYSEILDDNAANDTGFHINRAANENAQSAINVAKDNIEAGGFIACENARARIKSEIADRDSVRCLDCASSARMVELIDRARECGDSLGGEIEIVARGLFVGVGSHVQYDRRLDNKIAAMLMSIPSVKGVHIGNKQISSMMGSRAVDPMYLKSDKVFRTKNDSGGIDGGISNGEDVVVTLFVKPVPTLRNSTHSFNIKSGSADKAHYERSDICVVPAISVVAENLLAYVLADTILGELGGDTMTELKGRLVRKTIKFK